MNNPIRFTDPWGLSIPEEEQRIANIASVIRAHETGFVTTERLIENLAQNGIDIFSGEVQSSITTPIGVFRQFYENQIIGALSSAGTRSQMVTDTRPLLDSWLEVERLYGQGLITGFVHNVPLIHQGRTQWCTLYAQFMGEAHHAGRFDITQEEADRIIRGWVHGENRRTFGDNWIEFLAEHRPGIPYDRFSHFVTNRVGEQMFGPNVILDVSLDSLFDNLLTAITDGPLYAFYSNPTPGEAGHVAVIVGIAQAPGRSPLVLVNDSANQGEQIIQPFNNFVVALPSGMRFDYAIGMDPNSTRFGLR